MGGIDEGVYFIPALNAALCSVLSSYTLISILDHERWMKEWGDDHEAEAVMHLRTPILSAAIAMGLGGITTVHQVALSSVHLEREIGVGANVIYTCLAAVTGVATLFAMLYVARLDAFAGVDRVERLKEVILNRHTISELKLKKGLGKRVAYMGKLHHVVGAGATLATGIMGVWALNVLGLTGEFVVVLSTPGVMYLAVYVLVTSIVSCWLLFRVLVWKPSYEYLRPLCSAFFALSLWSVDYIGKTVALVFSHAQDGLLRSTYGWSLEASRGGGEFLMVMMAFGAVLTQYAIALELRLAYCGLQDTNLDLQLLAGTGDAGEHTRKSSAIQKNTSKRRNTGGGRGNSARSAPTRSRRRSVVVHAAASCPGSPASSMGSPMSPGSLNSSTMNLSRSPSIAGGGSTGRMMTSTSVLSAVFRLGSKPPASRMGKIVTKHNQQSRIIRVQSAGAQQQTQTLVYEPSVAEDSDEDRQLPAAMSNPPPTISVVPPPDPNAGWEVVQPTKDGKPGAMFEMGPLKQWETSPDSAV